MTRTPDDALRELLAQGRARDQVASARIFGTGHQAEDKEPDQEGGTLPDPAVMLAAAVASMEGDDQDAG